MKRMKKLLISLLTLSMLLTLAACGGEKPAAPSVEDPADEVEEQQTVFDFGAYAVELKDAELTAADYGFDCLMLTLAYANTDPDENGTLGENISVKRSNDRCITFTNFYDNEGGC